MPDQTFNKEERLKSKKILSRMFTEGYSFNSYPLRVIWLPILPPNTKASVQFTVSVPRKKFNKAVQRNRIKRQIREAYRLNKHLLYDQLPATDQQFGLMMIYVAKEPLPYDQIEKAMKKIIKRLPSEFNKS